MKKINRKQGLNSFKKDILKKLMGSASSTTIDFNKILKEYNMRV